MRPLYLKITTDLEDTSGNALTEEFNHTFSYQGADLPIYDRVPPEVERAEYASGDFSITLTEEFDSTTLSNSVEIISPTQTIGGTVTADGPRKLSFSPSQSLQNETEYTLKVKTSLKDLANKPLTEFTQTFIFDNTDHLLFEKPNQKEHGESYVKNTTLFQGREYDPETGLYYFRARYYAPKLSMFIQLDPMGYEDSMNLYQGMGNNPVNFMDPTGTFVDYSMERNHKLATPGDFKGWDVQDRFLGDALRRGLGGLKLAGGIFMAKTAAAWVAATGGLGSFLGGSTLMLKGVDLAWSGIKDITTGVSHDTVSARVAGYAANKITSNSNLQNYISNFLDLGTDMGLVSGGLKATIWAQSKFNIAVNSPDGIGEIYHYEIGRDNHFSVKTIGKETLHSEQIVIDSNLNTTHRMVQNTPIPKNVFRIYVPNIANAQAMQISKLGANTGVYNSFFNSCLTEACKILNAGGANLPETTMDAIKFLLKLL